MLFNILSIVACTFAGIVVIGWCCAIIDKASPVVSPLLRLSVSGYRSAAKVVARTPKESAEIEHSPPQGENEIKVDAVEIADEIRQVVLERDAVLYLLFYKEPRTVKQYIKLQGRLAKRLGQQRIQLGSLELPAGESWAVATKAAVQTATDNAKAMLRASSKPATDVAAVGPQKEQAVEIASDAAGSEVDLKEKAKSIFRGKLINHGFMERAAGEKLIRQYCLEFMDSETGAPETVWGNDLRRALDAVKPAVGDRLEILKLGKQKLDVEKGAPRYMVKWHIIKIK